MPYRPNARWPTCEPIPWVFSWTQNRCLLPAWDGLGAALTEVKYKTRLEWQTLCEMYRQWPFFQATIDNAALALAKADMYIGQRYSGTLHRRRQPRTDLDAIASERDRSRQAILDVVGEANCWPARRGFKARSKRAYRIDPLNLLQIELLKPVLAHAAVRRRRRLGVAPGPAASDSARRRLWDANDRMIAENC